MEEITEEADYVNAPEGSADKKATRPEEITEEADYVNAPEGPADKKATRPEDTKKEAAPEGTVDTKASPPGLRFFLPIAVCWIILLAIMGLRIYFDTSSHETLLATNKKLSLENAILTKDNKNLTQAYNVSESNIKNLSAGVQELNTQNQELETEKKNLKQQIQDMETNWNELNVSRAQWSIDSYCLGNTDKKCQRCQKGWRLLQLKEPSCIEFNKPPSSGWKTWAEAQEDCSGKNSNLSVTHQLKAANNTESYRGNRFWIGLRVVNKKWEWVDGSDPTDSSWIYPPAPADGHCAVFYKGSYWYSASCDEKQEWICKKKALSV